MPRPLACGYKTRFTKVKLVFVVAVAILFWTLCLPVCLRAQAPPSADSFVSSATPKINYGSSISLVVGPRTNAFMQFNLSGIPTGSTISKATLRLYVDAVVNSGSFDVYQINNAWNERTLTYDNAPSPGASATGSHPVTVAAASCNQFLLIDVTTLVRGWANGTTPNNGVALALTSGSNGNFSFDSKESLLTGMVRSLKLLSAAVESLGRKGRPVHREPAV